MQELSAGTLPLPVSLVPLVGGVFGLLMAALLGYVTTKKAGTPFAMITLGIGELVWSMSLMLPEFFGGEGGVSSNRVIGQPVWGISFGPQIQVYYLIAAYCFVSTAAIESKSRSMTTGLAHWSETRTNRPRSARTVNRWISAASNCRTPSIVCCVTPPWPTNPSSSQSATVPWAA